MARSTVAVLYGDDENLVPAPPPPAPPMLDPPTLADIPLSPMLDPPTTLDVPLPVTPAA